MASQTTTDEKSPQIQPYGDVEEQPQILGLAVQDDGFGTVARTKKNEEWERRGGPAMRTRKKNGHWGRRLGSDKKRKKWSE